jgi:hypothetical protein
MVRRLQLLSLAIAALAFTGIADAAPADQANSPLQKIQGSSVNCPSGAYTAPTAPASSGGVTTIVYAPSNHNTADTDVTCLQKEVVKKLKMPVSGQVTCKEDNSTTKGAVVCRFPTNSMPKS